MTHCWFS